MTLRVIWKATNDRVLAEDKEKHFRFEGFRAIAQAEAMVIVPSLKFSWRSDPAATSRADFAVIGQEVNGRYFDERARI